MSVPNNMDMTNLMSQHPNPLLGIPPAFFLRAASERYQRYKIEIICLVYCVSDCGNQNFIISNA